MCFRQKNRKGKGWTWEKECGQSVARELGVERYKREEGQAWWATVGTLNLNAVRSHSG